MKDDTTTHQHLCAECNKKFDCTDQSDAEYEFALCPDCKAKPRKSGRKKNRR